MKYDKPRFGRPQGTYGRTRQDVRLSDKRNLGPFYSGVVGAESKAKRQL